MSSTIPEMDQFGSPGMNDADFIAVPKRASFGKRARRALTRSSQTAGVFLMLCAAWETMSRLDFTFWPTAILPPLTDIFPALIRALGSDFLWRHLWVTFQEGMIGFFIGGVAAFVLGVLIALSPAFSRATYPLIVAFQATPHSALAPVFIAWLGFGMESKIALVITSCFFPVLVCTVAGLRLAEENKLLLMRSLRATKLQEFFFLRLPNAMPTIFAGIQTTAVAGLVAAVFAEMIGSQEGVGHLIKAASFQFRMPDVFAYLVILSALGVSLFGVVVLIQHRVISWSREPSRG